MFSPLPEGLMVTTKSTSEIRFDGIQLFTKDSIELHAMLNDIAYLVLTTTVAWVCYPKKSSGIESDIMMMGHWEVLAQYNLEVVAATLIDAI